MTNLEKEAPRVAGIAGRRRQIRKTFAPETDEFMHEHFAKILAHHRRKSNTEVIHVSTGHQSDGDRPVQTNHFVETATRGLLASQHHAVLESMLKQGAVMV